ncbi:MAG: cation transporter [Pseudomonadota bacterium]
MSSTHADAENRYLLIAAAGAAVIGCVGVSFSFLASSEAILLDGMFNLVYFVAALVTMKVARLVHMGDSQDFPFGYAAFEPLVNGIKGVLMLGVMMMALVGAVEAILTGGHSIDPGPAVVYGAVAAAACWALAIVAGKAAKKTGSPLIHADALNWQVNGAISTAVLAAFIGVMAIEGTSLQFVAPYVDSSLVILVVIVSISVPIRMAWQALMELLARAPSNEIIEQVRKTIEDATDELPIQEIFLRIIQPGRTRMVLVYVVLPEDFEVGRLATLDALRAKTQDLLRALHPDTIVDMIFTADPKIGALSTQPVKA